MQATGYERGNPMTQYNYVIEGGLITTAVNRHVRNGYLHEVRVTPTNIQSACEEQEKTSSTVQQNMQYRYSLHSSAEQTNKYYRHPSSKGFVVSSLESTSHWKIGSRLKFQMYCA